jgi:adenylylsulfate reductase subunit A
VATARHVDFNPNYIKPNGMMYRLMKATHEYGAGTATYYQTTSKSLEIIMDMLQTMREDCEKLAAGDLHELMRAWEIEHRIWTVESHLRHIQYRKETRYPGFYYQADYPGQDDENWFCFRQLQVRSGKEGMGCLQERLHQDHPGLMQCRRLF